MIVKNIYLKNFRNYENTAIKFSDKVNIIYGNNAQGKTNILESIYLFTTGKSYRTNKDSELIKFSKPYAKILIDFVSRNTCNTSEIILCENKKKIIKINNIPINKMSKLMGFFNAVIFSPEDLDLIKNGPSKRRKFLDVCISQIRPSYFYNLQQYTRVLKQRNNLLKTNNRDKSFIDILSIWDKNLIKYGTKIILDRLIFIDKLNKYSQKIHYDITGNNEKLSIIYLSGIYTDKSDIIGMKKDFEKKLILNRQKEIRRGITLIGPHRDDIDFMINKIQAKKYGSQGQQRTVALSLKMSEMEILKDNLGEYPVLLLDDIMSELDESRQNYLFKNFNDKQVFITCTDFNNRFIKNDNITFIKVENGNILRG